MKLPPPEKIYEAWSALASGRFASDANPVSPEGDATIISSGGQKEYRVHWQDNIFFANDPASWWQGYAGYPVLAALMFRNMLPYDPDIANLFASVQWEKINKKAARNYALALEYAMSDLKLSDTDQEKARAFAGQTFSRLQELPIEVRRLSRQKHASQ